MTQTLGSPSSPEDRLQEILESVLRRRRLGEKLPDAQVMAEFPDMAELIRAELVKLPPPDSSPETSSDLGVATPGQFYDESFATIDQIATPTKGAALGGQSIREPRAPTQGDANRFRKIKRFKGGGMGDVWLAIDTQFRREVLLKELKFKSKSEQVRIDRLISEGHITGHLEHPGIVPVYALGVDSMGQPYYVMRRVLGDPMDDVIEAFHEKFDPKEKFSRHNLEFRGILTRLAEVCNTVAYAHSRGVLHRDLKPGNIMFGKYGETCVIDWGLARVVGARGEDYSLVTEDIISAPQGSTGSATREGSLLGTPGYMSPEQAEGLHDRLSVTTDVYSLGAILYAVLTNRQTLDFHKTDLTGFLKRVKSGDFQQPQECEPTAPKELCAVTLKAMALRSEDRYQSTRELAAEIERWLADQAVTALPETRKERLARSARHHYRWITSAVAALLIITALAISAAIAINRSRRSAEHSAVVARNAAAAEEQAKERAENHFLQARDTVDEWLTGFTEALQYYPGVQDFRRRMLEQAAGRYEQFLNGLTQEEIRDDYSVALEAARTRLRVGNIYRALRADGDAEKAYTRSAEIFEQLIEHNADDANHRVAARDGLANAFDRLALTYGVANASRALEFHQRALKTAEQNLSEAADVEGELALDAAATYCNSEINYANFLAVQGKTKEAAELFSTVVTRLERLVQSDSRIETRISLAKAMLGWGQVISKLGDTARAHKIFLQAGKYFEAVAQLAGDVPRHTMHSAQAQTFLAVAAGQLGDYVAEASAYRQVIAAYDALDRDLPGIIEFQEERARTQVDLGQALLKLGDAEASLETLDAAEQALAKLKAEHPADGAFRESHGLALDFRSRARAMRGDFDGALADARASVAELEGLAQEFPDIVQFQLRTATSQSQLAQILALRQDYAAAGEIFAKAATRLAALLAATPDDPAIHYATAAIHSRWGESLALAGDAAGADAQAEAAEPHWSRLIELSSDAEYVASAAWHFVSYASPGKRNATRAEELARVAARQAPNNEFYVAIIALAELEQGRAEKGLAALAAAKPGENNPFAATMVQLVRALAQADAGQKEDAEREFAAGKAVVESRFQGNWELQSLLRLAEKKLATSEATPSAASEPATESKRPE